MFRYALALCLLGGIAAYAPTHLLATLAERSEAKRAAGAASVGDTVIFDNVAPNGGLNAAGASPASQYDAVFPYEAGAADDFVLPPSPQCTWVVTGVRWTGVYWSGEAPGTITGFRIIIWSDDTDIPSGGGGSTPDLAEALAVYSVPGNAHETPSAAGAPQAYAYWADLPEPFEARPGVRYWLQIQAAMVSPPQWGWHVTHNRQGDAPACYFDLLGLLAWSSISDPGDLGFQLLGEPHDIACDDGDACTENGCVNGECAYTPVTCDDGSACTDDSCDPALGCVFTAITCDDGSACTDDSCSPATGCVFTPIACDDDSACTDDSCDPVKGCVHTDITCDDESACTTDTCDPSTGCVHTPIACIDNDTCTDDTCDPVKGCVYTPIACDDDDACTDDTCDAMTGCVYSTITCDDRNACTEDTCDPSIGCVYTQSDCNDADACTEDSCDPASGCVYTSTECDDGDACTDDTCESASGCVYTSVICDDQDACTVDTCIDGECVYAAPPDFDGDGDVDLDDFYLFHGCMAGSVGGDLKARCPCTDLNGDGLKDLTDYAAFQCAFTGKK